MRSFSFCSVPFWCRFVLQKRHYFLRTAIAAGQNTAASTYITQLSMSRLLRRGPVYSATLHVTLIPTVLRRRYFCCTGQREVISAMLRTFYVTEDTGVMHCSTDVSSRRRLADNSAPAAARQQYLVRMSGSSGPDRVAALRQELADVGARLGDYVPLHTHLVQALPSSLAAIRRLEGVGTLAMLDCLLWVPLL